MASCTLIVVFNRTSQSQSIKFLKVVTKTKCSVKLAFNGKSVLISQSHTMVENPTLSSLVIYFANACIGWYASDCSGMHLDAQVT